MKKNGFTLVELLISITIIAILGGVGISVINPVVQRNRAQDGVRRSNLEKLAQAVRSYCIAENVCPTESEYSNSASSFRMYYVDANTFNIADYAYTVSGSNFEIRVPLLSETSPQNYYKFNSTWDAIRQCTKVTMGEC